MNLDAFERAVKVYETLDKLAIDGIFQGSKVEAYDAAHVSRVFYTEIFESLKESGCIAEHKRGGGRRGLTVIELLSPPDRDTFVEFRRSRRLTQTGDRGKIVEQRLSDLERRLQGIDLIGYIAALETRLRGIEARLVMVEAASEGKDLNASQEKIEGASPDTTGGR